MNWHDRDCFDPTYFRDICTALQQRTFLQPATSASVQLGHWIVDRADQVLATCTHLEPLPATAEQAIKAFEYAAEHYPEDIARHFRDSAGTTAFRGLFCTRHLDIYSMWARIAQRTNSHWHSEDCWLHKLACTLLRDSEFSTKLDEAAECCRLGLNRRDTLARIEQHHRQMDSANTSAKSLLMLDLL